MRQSLTVVLERNVVLTGDFATEPYEVAWASEARWFVRILELCGRDARLEARTQISPDGLHWCDLGGDSVTLRENGLTSWPIRDFGGWLRLKGTVTGGPEDGGEVGAKVLIYLVLKE